MKLWSASLFGAIAAISIVLAIAIVWLVLTDPVSVATSISQGEVTPLVQELAQVILDALRGLLRYL